MRIHVLLKLTDANTDNEILASEHYVKTTYRSFLPDCIFRTEQEAEAFYTDKISELSLGLVADRFKDPVQLLKAQQLSQFLMEVNFEYKEFLKKLNEIKSTIAQQQVTSKVSKSKFTSFSATPAVKNVFAQMTNSPDQTASIKMLNAATINNLEKVKEAIKEGADIYYRGVQHRAPDVVCLAVMNNNRKMLSYLLSPEVRKTAYDFDFYQHDVIGDVTVSGYTTPLKVAISKNNSEMVKKIIGYEQHKALTGIYAKQDEIPHKSIFPELYQCNDDTFSTVMAEMNYLQQITNVKNRQTNKTRFLQAALHHFATTGKKIERLSTIIRKLNVLELKELPPHIMELLKKGAALYPEEFKQQIAPCFGEILQTTLAEFETTSNNQSTKRPAQSEVEVVVEHPIKVAKPASENNDNNNNNNQTTEEPVTERQQLQQDAEILFGFVNQFK